MSVHLNIVCLVCINLHYTSAEHLLKGRKQFSQSLVVSVAVLTDLVFVQPGAKINGAYYCDHMLKQGLLLDVRGLSNDAFLFQHDMLKQEGIVR